MPIKNHRLKDANQQGGSKWSAIGRVVKDIVKNPAVREIAKEGLKLGVEVGTPILIDKLSGKPVNAKEVIREQVRERVAEEMQGVKETYADRLRLIQQALQNKEIDAYQAKELFDRAKEEFNRNQTTGSGIRGQDVLKKLAMKNIQKGRYTKSGGAVVCTKQYPPPPGCRIKGGVQYACPMDMSESSKKCRENLSSKFTPRISIPINRLEERLRQEAQLFDGKPKYEIALAPGYDRERAIRNAYGLDGSGRKKKGGALPLAAIAAVGLPILGAISAGLLQPVMEKVSERHLASKI